VSGPRLLAVDAGRARGPDRRADGDPAGDRGLVDPHPVPAGGAGAPAAEAGFLLRSGVQFHWMNAGYATFDEFLATLEQKKRKNIRAERRKVARGGRDAAARARSDITDERLALLHRCYRHTYAEHYSKPYLNLDFFRRIGKTMPENLLLVIAERDGRPIAASLVVHDADTLYGRYWGALEHVPCLHFEAAYYQPLEFCIEQGIQVFEGGAQGEHKMARGFLPTRTWSAHWLAHPSFADAVERFLEREAAASTITSMS
jgi:predicted N-acyltransferase